jgi:hypothetical protein
VFLGKNKLKISMHYSRRFGTGMFMYENKQSLMTYSSSLAMNRQRFGSRNQNTTTFKDTRKAIGPVSNTIILLVLACLVGLLYLTQVTKTNAFGYRINDLQKKHATLSTEHDELAVASARLQALERVKNSKVAQGLVSVAPSGTVRN